jgi:ribosome-associated protein
VKKRSSGTRKLSINKPRSKRTAATEARARATKRPSAPERRPGKAAKPARPTGKMTGGAPIFTRGLPAPPPPPSARETERHQESRASAVAAIEAALDKKALVPVLLDVSGRATYTDFIGVVSGRSDRQVDAIAEHVRDVMGQRGSRLLGREGAGNGRWTLLDFGDVVLHIFYHPVRDVYDIEGLWIDAPRVKLNVPPEAQLYQTDALYGAL